MTPEQFIDALVGEGWTLGQLPGFVLIIGQAQEDAKRYHELREQLANQPGAFIASRSDLNEIDRLVDEARSRGFL